MPLVEKRYAEALVSLSIQHSCIDDIQAQLGSIVYTFNTEPTFKSFLLNPEIKTDVKKDAVKNILSGKIRNEILNFLMLLLDKGRIRYLPGMLAEYTALADKMRNVLNMQIISAVPLDAIQSNRITEKYRQMYNASAVKVEAIVDTSVIGGVKVVLGDKVIDGTVKGRLKELERLLIED